MAYGMKLKRCYKCNKKTVMACHWCGDNVCHYHSELDSPMSRSCFPCVAKYYRQWLLEKEYEFTTEMEYKDWLEKKLDEEMDVPILSPSDFDEVDKD